MLAFLLLVSSTASAQLSIGPYTIAGGGGTSENGPNKITGTIGQPLAGDASAGNIRISGGFWPVVAQTSDTTPTPTPTPMETVTETPTASGPTTTPTPTEPDLDIGDPDGFIDAKDLVEILDLLREQGIDPETFFQLSVYWQGEYPPAASSMRLDPNPAP